MSFLLKGGLIRYGKMNNDVICSIFSTVSTNPIGG